MYPESNVNLKTKFQFTVDNACLRVSIYAWLHARSIYWRSIIGTIQNPLQRKEHIDLTKLAHGRETWYTSQHTHDKTNTY